MIVACALATFAACGRISYEPLGTPDASGILDASDAPDGPDAATPESCPWTGTFGFTTPEPIAALEAYAAGNAFLSPDGLSLYVSYEPIGGASVILRLGRATRDSPFDAPTTVSELSGLGRPRRFSYTADGLSGLLALDAGMGVDVYAVSRTSVSTPWAIGDVVPELSSEVNDQDAFIAPSGLSALVARTEATSTTQEVVFFSRTAPTDPFGTGTIVPFSGGSAADPSVTGDGRVLVLTGVAGAIEQLFYSRRASAGDPWPMPEPIPDLATTTSNENEAAISADGCELVFNTLPPGGTQLRMHVARYVTR